MSAALMGSALVPPLRAWQKGLAMLVQPSETVFADRATKSTYLTPHKVYIPEKRDRSMYLENHGRSILNP